MAEKVGLEAVLQMGDFNHNLNVYLKGLDKINRETVKTAASSSKAMGGVGDFFRGVAQVATGIGLADALRATGGAIDYVARQAIGAASTFQGLRIQMEGLIAGSLRNADANLTVADSLDKAIPLSKDLLSWIRQTAVTTPFTVETLSTMTAMNLGMGRSVDEAKALSIAVGNMTSGLGLGGTEAERITRALNQMASKGKVTGQDLLQLSDASVPLQLVWAQLGKQFQVTAQQAREMASSGAISANDFITAFADVANNQFPGAMERMSGTLEGVTSNIKDFISTVIGIDVLGPAIEKFTSDAKGTLNRLMEPDAQGMARAIGEMLSAGYDEVAAFVSDAFGFGQNVAVQFANGILDGAAAVLDALANIGSLIAYWLAPGSPPRILPDLPAWGADAMGEYMAGWGKADIGVFSEMSGAIEKALRDSMPKDDKAGQVALIDRVFGARSAAAAAIEEMRRFGDVSDASLQRVFDAAGMVSPRMQAYLRTLFQLEGVNARVAAAQDELTKAQQAYDAALKAADDRIDAVTEAEQRLADQVQISQLQLIANDPGATALEKERARLKIEKIRADQAKRNVIAEKKGAVDAAKIKLDAAKSDQDRLEAQADAQKAVLGIQSEQNKLLGEQLKLIDEIAKAAAAAAKAGAGKTPTPMGGGRLNLAAPELAGGEDLAEAFKQSILKKVDEVFGPLRTKLGAVQSAFSGVWSGIQTTLAPAFAAFDRVKLGWDNFVKALEESSPRAQQYVASMITFLVVQLGPVLTGLFDNVAVLLNTGAELWRKYGDDIMGVVNFAFRIVTTVVAGALTLVTGLFTAFLQARVGDWSGAWDTIKRTLENFFQIALNLVGVKLEDFKQTWGFILGATGALIYKFFAVDVPAWATKMFDDLKTNFTGFVKTIQTSVGTWFEKAKEFIAEIKWLELGENIVKGIANGVIGAAGWLYQAVGDMIRNALTSGQDEMDAHSPSRKAADMLGEPIPEGAAAGIWRKIDLVRDASLAMVNSALRPAQSAGSYSYSYSNVNNFNLSVATRASDQSVVSHFNTMRAMAGMP